MLNIFKTYKINFNNYILYSTHFRNWEFMSDELNSKDSVLDVYKSFISHPNYFEFVDRIQFSSKNDISLYNDSTNNLFSDILLLDALLSSGMKALIDLFVKRLSLAIKHIANKNNVDKKIQINDSWDIILLDKKQLYTNKETFPNFYYTVKGVSKNVGKVTKIKDSIFKKFRKMIPSLINSNEKNKGNFITKYIFIWIL